MKYSKLQEIQRQQQVVSTFGGYNHNLVIGGGEFYDMKNMSLDDYPVISTRKQNGSYKIESDNWNAQYRDVKGAISYGDKNIVINHYGLFINDTLLADPSDPAQPWVGFNGPHMRTMILMGAYLLIFPDKVYINLEDLSDKGYLDGDDTLTNIRVVNCDATSAALPGSTTVVSATKPASPKNGMIWIDNSSLPATKYKYSESTGMWLVDTEAYFKITGDGARLNPGFAKGELRVGDMISVEGASEESPGTLGGKYFEIVKILKGSNWHGFVLKGVFGAGEETGGTIHLTRNTPDMDFVVEWNNRLWGCRYGMQYVDGFVPEDGKPVNEIYASKLGDFRNWKSYRGTSQDSYTASCGKDGEWTGAIVHQGHPLFFKNHTLYKVYGNAPSNFQLQTTDMRGVMPGADRTLAIVNETLFYKSLDGLCAYDGSLPVDISQPFGSDKHNSRVEGHSHDDAEYVGCGGALYNKYYVSLVSDEDSKMHTYVYDINTGTWCKEEHGSVHAYYKMYDDLYYVGSDDRLYSVNGHGKGEKEGDFDWMLESGDMGLDASEMKYVSSLVIRMALDHDAEAHIYVKYDSDDWQHVSSLHSTELRSVSVPVRIHRCDHFKIKIEGHGDAKIYSITKAIEYGGYRYR